MSEPVPNLMDEQQPRPEPLRLPTPPKLSPVSRHNYLETVLSTPREQETQPCRLDNSTIPCPSAFIPQSQAPVMSLHNATSETLVTPTKAEQASSVNKDTTTQAALRNNDNLGYGQDFPNGTFCIDCNSCGKSIPDEHYHCGICDDGDFDLCSACIAADVTCDGEGHWLIKRRIQNGVLVSSVTETIAPKKWQEDKSIDNKKENKYDTRTCNSCILGKDQYPNLCSTFTDLPSEVPSGELVACTNCADYDLCLMCFSLGDHGHHPGHRFQPVSPDTCKISSRMLSLCEPGRGVAHAAICDGCDKVRAYPGSNALSDPADQIL